ncbi:redoxin domain-containing protein [bacterium]|nr:redoxin domain-containing protein [bacterium]
MEKNKRLPDFALFDQNKKEIKFSELKGKKLLLSFHPLAWTPICRAQMLSLENNYKKFLSLNTVPFGISVDSVPSKSAWGKDIGLKQLQILSDFWPHGKFSKAMNAFYEDKGFSKRSNFIINESGIIIFEKYYDISQLPDVDEVLIALKEGRK